MRSMLLPAVLFALLLPACGRSDHMSDLAELPSAPAIEKDSFVRYVSVADSDFCQNRPAEQCFTLVIGVPAPQLEKNLPLNTLALAMGAEKFRAPMLKACHQGMIAYALGHQGLSFTLRNRLFSGIKETRCAVDYILRETYELPALPEGQYGLATRLANWDVRGETAEKHLAPLTFTVKNANLDVAYRNTMVFARPVEGQESQWSALLDKSFRPMGGYTPLGTQDFVLNFNGSMSARFSAIETAQELAVILEHLRNADITRDSLRGFFSEAASVARAIVSGNLQESAVALVALGIDALKALSGEDLAKLKISKVEVAEAVRQGLGDADVIDSTTNALFADSHQVLPAKLIDDAFWHAHGDRLRRDLGFAIQSNSEDLWHGDFEN